MKFEVKEYAAGNFGAKLARQCRLDKEFAKKIDSDPEDDPLTVVSATQGANGST